jgi:hypothetical protein
VRIGAQVGMRVGVGMLHLEGSIVGADVVKLGCGLDGLQVGDGVGGALLRGEGAVTGALEGAVITAGEGFDTGFGEGFMGLGEGVLPGLEVGAG